MQTGFSQLQHFSAGAYFITGLILLGAQIARKKENQLQRWFLWLLVLVNVVNLICFACYYVAEIDSENYVFHLDLLQSLVVPACMLLMTEISRPGTISWRSVGLLMAPLLILWALYTATGRQEVYHAAMLLACLIGIISLCFTLRNVIRFRRMLCHNYSNIDHRDIKWLLYIMLSFGALLIIWAIASAWQADLGNTCYNLASCALWVAVYYFINRQEVIRPLPPETEDVHPETCFHFAEQLQKSIEQDKCYLDPELCLQQLAQALRTNRTYLSQYFNNVLQTTFYDYINRLRIEHAARLLIETDDKIEVVAMQSGFNSITTFRRIFQKHFGMKASQYRMTHRHT